MDSSVLLFLILLNVIYVSQGDIYLYNKNSVWFFRAFEDEMCRSGPDLQFQGIKGYLQKAEPIDGCGPMAKAEKDQDEDIFVIVRRYNCTFEEKVRHAQAANFSAMIVFNVDSDILEPMYYQNSTGINIPAMFVAEETGMILLENAGVEGTYVVLEDGVTTNVFFMFCLVGISMFLLMLAILIIRCIRNRRRRHLYLLPASVLKTIPKRTYEKTDTYETCVICQENFNVGDVIRVLQCSHAYHAKCIDVWLTQYKRVCAICKHRVLAPNEPYIHFDSDSESEPDDRTPLLRTENSLNPDGSRRIGGTYQSLRERLSFLRSSHSTNVDNQQASSSHSSHVGVGHSVNSAPQEFDDNESLVSSSNLDSVSADNCSGTSSTRVLTSRSIDDVNSADLTRSELSHEHQDGGGDSQSAASGVIIV